VKIYFFHNCVKFLPTLIIFGTTMAKTMELCKEDLFSTSPDIFQRITMWNRDAPNCYISRRLFVSDCSPWHHQLDRGRHM